MDAPAAMLEALLGADRVLLTGPVPPDGDSLGACLALQRVLRHRGHGGVEVAGNVPWRYAWMPGADALLPDADVTPGWDAVVVLDGDRHRLAPPVEQAFHAARLRGIIDHHASTRADGYTHMWLEIHAASACGMLYRALGGWGVALDPDLAAVLYTGVVFDTGGFRHSNTSPETHQLAAELLATGIDHAAIAAKVLAERRPAGLRAMGQILGSAGYHLDGALCVGRVPLSLRRDLGLVEGDLEGVVDALVHSVGTEVGALVLERPDGTVKYSLRSRGRVDVSQVAQELAPTGGGHAKAAGASIPATVERAEELLLEVVAKRIACTARGFGSAGDS